MGVCEIYDVLIYYIVVFIIAVTGFAQQMNRQTVLNHTIQGAKAVLRDQEIVKKMLVDWLKLDLQSVTKDISAVISEEGEDAKLLYYIRTCK